MQLQAKMLIVCSGVFIWICGLCYNNWLLFIVLKILLSGAVALESAGLFLVSASKVNNSIHNIYRKREMIYFQELQEGMLGATFSGLVIIFISLLIFA